MKTTPTPNKHFFCIAFSFFVLFAVNSNAYAFKKAGEPMSMDKAEQYISQTKQLGFQENKGQFAGTNNESASYVLFKASVPNLNIWVTTTGLTYQFLKLEENEAEKNHTEEDIKNVEWRRVDMIIKNADIKKENIITEGNITQGNINYFLGHCPNGVFDVKTYTKITIKNIYAGIDWVLYTSNTFSGSFLKQDFIVHPNADANQLKLVYEGSGIFEAQNNQLTFENQLGKIAEGTLLCYQGNESNSVPSKYFVTKNTSLLNLGAGNFSNEKSSIEDKNEKMFSYEVSVDVNNYNKNADLVIDPQLFWSTFYGGSDAYEAVLAMDCNQITGDLIVTGYVGSTNFPVVNVSGSYSQTAMAGVKDVYVSKFNSVGVPQWVTYYGGSAAEQPWALCIDQSSNIIITGETSSLNFPVQDPGSGAYFQATNTNNSQEAFILKFDSNGARIWCTLYGGSLPEVGNGIAVDASGNIFIVGETSSTNISLVNPGGGAYTQSNTSIGGFNESFIAKFSNTGVLLWATYYGGGSNDVAYAVTCDATGNVFMTGETSSFGSGPFPTLNPGGSAFYDATMSGNADGFIVKFDNNGVRQWATMFGGTSSIDKGYSIKCNSNSDVIVTGLTASLASFPLLNPGGGAYYQATNGNSSGSIDAFILKFDNNGVQKWGTYYGGSGTEEFNTYDNIVIDTCNNVFISFNTESTDVPTINSANCALSYFDATHNGAEDLFIAKFNDAGVHMWGSYLGGDGSDWREAMAIDLSGNFYIGGEWTEQGGVTLNAATYPFTNPGGGAYFDAAFDVGTSDDAYIVNFKNLIPTLTPSSTNSAGCNGCNGTATISVNCGDPSFNYVWSNGSQTLNSASNTNTITGLCPGTYTVTVTSGCNVLLTASINVGGTLGVTPTVTTSGPLAINCNNATGTISANATPVNSTYNWAGPGIASGGNTSTATVNAGGTYTVTVTDVIGCSATATIVVTTTSNPTVTITLSNTICNGGNAGSATATVAGGVASYNYSWTTTPIQTTATATNLTAGSYTCTVTDANGCTATNSATITQPIAFTATISSSANLTCNGVCNGTATVTPNGGTPTYSYSWNTNPIQTNATASGLCAGTYIVTITDLNGCTASATTIITEPSPITSSIIGVDAVCNGATSGSAIVTANGGTPNYSYSWSTSPVQTTANATNLSAGTYTCTTTDANGCTATSFITINQPTPLVATISSTTNVSCNGACNGTASASASGSIPNYSYSWNTTPVQTTASINGLCAGTYIVTVTDANGCTATATANIIQQSTITTNITSTNALCNGGTTGTATITVNGGAPAYSYSWTTSPIQTTANATNLAAGSYTCTVTDANGCTATNTVTITQPQAITETFSSSTTITCNGQCNGSVTVTAIGGVPAYSYSWNSNPIQTTATATALCAGTYIVTITDMNGCTASGTAIITEPPPLTSSISGTDAVCNGAISGSATVSANGGTPNYNYSWSTTPVQTTATATNLAAGTYTCTTTDANGCTTTSSVTINEPTPLVASISSTTNVTCNGACNGTATATASGSTPNYSYSWNTTPVQTTASISGLCSGTYIVTVTDVNGCTATATANIIQQSTLTTTITNTNVLCNGGATGDATIIANGGTPAYNYAWTTIPAQTNATATNLAVGSYTCTVTDANGCTTTNTVTITEPNAISAAISSSTNILCNGACNGTATVTPNGGTPTYSYSWNTIPAQTNATASGLCAGTYIVTITDLNGCTASATTIITEPSPITSSIIGVDAVCNGATSGSANVTANGGTPTYSYSWSTSPVQTTANATNLSAGTYTCTTTDANGCTATSSVTINEPTPLVATITSTTNVTCNGACNGTATATASGSIPNYSYSWNTTPIQTTASISGLCAGTYIVTVTDANGCTATATANITQQSSLTTTITNTNALCNGGATGTATIVANGGTPAYNYAWTTTPAQTNATATNLTAGSYTCTVTDVNGCTTSNSVIITQPATIISSIGTSSNVTCNSLCNGSATVITNGGTPTYSYAWNTSPVQTTSTATGLCAGNYTVVVSDINGCTSSTSLVISEPAPLASAIVGSNIKCNGGNNGSATIAANGGTPSYSYSWSTTPVQTGTTITNIIAGTYTCTITDANGCTTSNSIVITEPTTIQTSITSTTNVSCNGNCDGTAAASVIGGTPNYSYSWNTIPVQTTAIATNLCPGVYTVVVTDLNGCTSSNTTNAITQPPVLTTAITSTNVLCNAGNNGSATVVANGGTPTYNYSWTTAPPQITSTAVNLQAGTYTCFISDANGCNTSTTVTIAQPNSITSHVTTTNVMCFGMCNGTATVFANGGIGATYNYSWNTSPAQTSATANALCAGNYTVTITDSNGCTATNTASITQPINAIAATVTNITNVTCNSANNGLATVSGNGGTAGYSYSWNTVPAQSSTTANSLAAGTYICTVTDAKGCTATNTVTITEPTAIVITTDDIILTCENNNSASVIVSGGLGGYSYSWNTAPTQTTAVLTNVPSGAYTVVVTDVNGCTQTHTINIINNLVIPTAGFTVSPTTASLYSNPIFDITDNSANGNTWYYDFGDGSGSSLQNPSHTYSDTGSYCITQTVINMPSGCKAEYTRCVKVEEDWTFYIPNAFTPNSNGTNDTFGGKGTGIKKYKMLIFDRWGNEIFKSDNINIGWDGRANKGAEVAQQDVYVYVVYLTDIKNLDHQYRGTVTLVK